MDNTSLPRQDINILLLEGASNTAVESFRAAGYTNIEHHEKSPSENGLSRAVESAYMVGLRSRNQLMAAGCFCIDTNQVDLDAAQACGPGVQCAVSEYPRRSPSWYSPSQRC